MEPVKKYRKSGLEHFLKHLQGLPAHSPLSVFNSLQDLGYRGQLGARRAMALMAYRHMRRIKRIYLEGVSRDDLLPKSNTLLIGPTGCGKTHLVETLFNKILGLPTVMVDITTFSETGYVGQDPSTILTRLLQAADENPYLAAVGVVCLDEFDKIASGQNNAVFAGAGSTKDVTGIGVQRELLKMLEGADVVVPLELAHTSYSDNIMMSTQDVAFVAAGAFSGFQQIIKRQGGADAIGFGKESQGGQKTVAVSFQAHEVEKVANFQAYGFLPELIARFSRIVPFEALSAATLLEILQSNVVQRLQREFEDEGFELSIDDEVLDGIVAQCLNQETGARGLSSGLTRCLEDAAFELFAEKEKGEVNLKWRDGRIVVDVKD